VRTAAWGSQSRRAPGRAETSLCLPHSGGPTETQLREPPRRSRKRCVPPTEVPPTGLPHHQPLGSLRGCARDVPTRHTGRAAPRPPARFGMAWLRWEGTSGDPPAQFPMLKAGSATAGCWGPSPAQFWAFAAGAGCWINTPGVLPQRLLSVQSWTSSLLLQLSRNERGKKKALMSSGNYLQSCTLISPCPITRRRLEKYTDESNLDPLFFTIHQHGHTCILSIINSAQYITQKSEHLCEKCCHVSEFQLPKLDYLKKPNSSVIQSNVEFVAGH